MIHAMRAVALVLLIAVPALPLRAAEEPPKITEETPYVPSPRIVVDTMLRMANVHAGDFLIDLGSGDGRIIITAAQEYQARGFGVDYDPRLVKLATDNAQKAGVADRARFVDQNVFKTDLSPASVVTIYLLPEYNAVLKPTLLALKPGTRIVSHDYGIGDWEPDAQSKVVVPEKPVGLEKASWIYYWMVPAQVAGQWRSSIPGARGATQMDISLNQQYQKVNGTARIGGRTLPIERPDLKGDHLTFELHDGDRHLHFEGRVSGDRLSGQLSLGNRKLPWRAQKFEAPRV